MFKKNDLRPMYSYMKSLFEMEDLPIRIWAALQSFPYHYTEINNQKYSKHLRFADMEDYFTR